MCRIKKKKTQFFLEKLLSKTKTTMIHERTVSIKQNKTARVNFLCKIYLRKDLFNQIIETLKVDLRCRKNRNTKEKGERERDLSIVFD